MYQNENPKSTTYKQWYAVAVPNDTITTDVIAELVQRNCSVKRSDVMAVLTELAEVFRDQLLAGNRVKINGIGTFKVGISTAPAVTRAEWNVTENIKSAYINFLPESVTESRNGARTRSSKALKGIEYMELRGYDDGNKKKEEQTPEP